MAREEVSSKMCLKRDSQEIKCAMIAHFISCPIKTNPKSILKEVEKLPRERG